MTEWGEQRYLPHAEQTLLGRCAVELHAETRRGRRKQETIFPHRLNREYVCDHRAGFARLLLNTKIGAGEVEVQAGCAGNHAFLASQAGLHQRGDLQLVADVVWIADDLAAQ